MPCKWRSGICLLIILNDGGFIMIYVYYGEESYLISLAKKRVFSSIEQSMNYRSTDSWDEEILDFLNTVPFMEEKKGVYLDIESLSKLDCSSFRNYIKNPAPFSELFIYVRNLNANTKFANELKKLSLLHRAKKLEHENDLIKYLLRELKVSEGRIMEDAMKEFLHRKNYFESDITLFEMISDLNSLLSINKDISLDMVTTYIKKNEVENRFSIAKKIMTQDIVGLKKECELIPSGEEIAVLAYLMKEYRIAWKNHITPMKGWITFKLLPLEKCLSGLKICTQSIDAIKEGTLPVENVLQVTFSKLVADLSTNQV